MHRGYSPRLRVFTEGYRRMIDATLSASAALVAVALVLGRAQDMVWADVGVSVLLALSGAYAGLPRGLLLASSLPVLSIDIALMPLTGSHAPALALVLFRAARIAWDIRSLAGHASTVGKEIISLVTQAGLMAGVMLLGGGLALYVAEKGEPGSMVHSFWDALWISIVTTTTVGYGDIVPSTPLGRLVAAMLMIFGVAYITFLLTSIAGLLARITASSRPEDEMEPYEREKHEILEAFRIRLGEMSDEEFWAAVQRLNVIRVLEAASDSEALEAVVLGPGGSRK